MSSKLEQIIQTSNTLLEELLIKVKELQHKADSLEICRATLYANYVEKATSEVHISKETADNLSTHGLMVEILIALTNRIDKCSS